MYLKRGLKMAAGCWGLLGFKRGMHDYDYDYDCKCKKKKDNKYYYDNGPYLYSIRIALGLGGVILYMNPLTAILFVIPREIFRLEVNLRNIEDEKNGDYYNKIM